MVFLLTALYLFFVFSFSNNAQCTVQCSTFPLPSNPIDATISSLVSLDKWEQRLLSPQQVPQTRLPQARPALSTAPSLHPSQISPKRYKRPTTQKALLHMLLHSSAGALFFYVTLMPSLLRYEVQPLVAQVCMWTCIVISTLTFTSTYLAEGNYHELTIAKSTDSSKPTILSTFISIIMTDVKSLMERSHLVLYWLISPLLCLTGSSFLYGTLSVTDGILALLVSYVATSIMCCFIVIADVISRQMLLVPGIDPDRLLFESYQFGNNYSVECLMVDLILGGLGDDIVEDVNSDRMDYDVKGKLIRIPPSSHIFRRTLDAEEEEVVRNDEMMSKVAEVVATGSVCGSLRLEEEILKISLLESLGGTGSSGDVMVESRLPFDVCLRHYHALKKRLGSTGDNKNGSTRHEIIPVLRAMCAYIGGLGESLTQCSDASAHLTMTNLNWSLPPLCMIGSEYAIRGASRLLLMSLADWDSSSGLLRKRYNRVSIFVPVLLHSIYRFRCGVLDHARLLLEVDSGWRKSAERSQTLDTFTRTRRSRTTPQEQAATLSFIATKCPILSSALTTCDSTATDIMKGINKIDGPRDGEVKVAPDCNEWLKSLI